MFGQSDVTTLTLLINSKLKTIHQWTLQNLEGINPFNWSPNAEKLILGDVQVIDVIDRCKPPRPLNRKSLAQTADLSPIWTSFFLSASMLVLFKANTLIEIEPETAVAVLEDDGLLPQDGVTGRHCL